jgi:hypothetical protein
MADVAMPLRSYHDRDQAVMADLLGRLRSAGGTGRVLLRGGTVLTMDPRIGDLAAGDVLVHGSQIEAVGPQRTV